MATTTPVLGGYTLPEPAYPDGYKEELSFRGASIEMADGSLVWDLVSMDSKRDFTLKWNGLTESQKVIVESAFGAIKSGYSTNNFTAPTGVSYTVTRHDSQKTLKWDTTMAAGNVLVWSTTMVLRQV